MPGENHAREPRPVEILVCPETKQPVAPPPTICSPRLNAEIAAGTAAQSRRRHRHEKSIAEGLLREDGRILYVVDDGIPVMLIEESIEALSGGAPLRGGAAPYWANSRFLSWRTYSLSSGSPDTSFEMRSSNSSACWRSPLSSKPIPRHAPSFSTRASAPRGFGDALM